ncbi:phosphoesterase RecJ domain protein [Nitratifractor salsuginis DSM 16511]|uniref:Phosphoesterase RecJ domain protein n=1 Tax=Nitratifractor salsuginis (strain DSM 16511 / JCM 12458 / E9I37-1) TaxID=749222 RepID=E6X2E2_NITSE|nr:phosphoesterase RecJ domain protein [Nitratifractor salsuginis DSM 16511]
MSASRSALEFTPKEREEFLALAAAHRSISVLSHIHPDADALGTSLGVYWMLKKAGHRVEVANATKELPRYLDFLPGFGKIKHKMDYEDSLVISCDCGSLDRLGFDLEGRKIVNIDHHPSNTRFGTLNLVRQEGVSSSEVAYRFFEPFFEIPAESAEAFYAALISDTRYFTTANVSDETFEVARELIHLGVDPGKVAQQMLQRRSLASLRILGRALESLELHLDGRVAVMTITREDLEATGARYDDLDGIVDYARSLVTVEIAILIVERPQDRKVSLRSKGADVMRIAQAFGGGGHTVAAGFETDRLSTKELVEALLKKIKEEGVLKEL